MVRSFLIVIIILSSFTKAQQNQLTGSIMGKVYDSKNKLGLPAVNVFLKDKNIGASTDIDGNFKIEKLPVGNYVIVFSYIGYSSATPVSYTHLPDHETVLDLVCRLLLEKKTKNTPVCVFIPTDRY